MTKQSQDNEARLVQEQSEELQEVFSNLPPEVQEWVRRTFPKEEVLRDLLEPIRITLEGYNSRASLYLLSSYGLRSSVDS